MGCPKFTLSGRSCRSQACEDRAPRTTWRTSTTRSARSNAWIRCRSSGPFLLPSCSQWPESLHHCSVIFWRAHWMPRDNDETCCRSEAVCRRPFAKARSRGSGIVVGPYTQLDILGASLGALCIGTTANPGIRAGSSERYGSHRLRQIVVPGCSGTSKNPLSS